MGLTGYFSAGSVATKQQLQAAQCGPVATGQGQLGTRPPVIAQQGGLVLLGANGQQVQPQALRILRIPLPQRGLHLLLVGQHLLHELLVQAAGGLHLRAEILAEDGSEHVAGEAMLAVPGDAAALAHDLLDRAGPALRALFGG